MLTIADGGGRGGVIHLLEKSPSATPGSKSQRVDHTPSPGLLHLRFQLTPTNRDLLLTLASHLRKHFGGKVVILSSKRSLVK